MADAFTTLTDRVGAANKKAGNDTLFPTVVTTPAPPIHKGASSKTPGSIDLSVLLARPEIQALIAAAVDARVEAMVEHRLMEERRVSMVFLPHASLSLLVDAQRLAEGLQAAESIPLPSTDDSDVEMGVIADEADK